MTATTMRDVVDALSDVHTDDGIAIWLSAQHRWLAGCSGIEACRTDEGRARAQGRATPRVRHRCGWPADEMFGDHGGQCLFAKAAQNGADGDRRRRGTEGGTSSV